MSVNPLPILTAATAGTTPREARSAIASLGDSFSRIFSEVNALQRQADAKIEEFATAPEKDIHGTMIALQKADVSLRLLLKVRAKLTTAYQEIMRMQV